MTIKWKNYVWDQVQLANKDKIRIVEEKWHIKFPDDYTECIIENQGRSPIPDSFDIKGQGEDSFSCLLHFEEGEAYEYSNIEKIYGKMANSLPKNVYPIAVDSAGNRICFDYRESSDSPKIVFWDHDTDEIIYLADSFKGFLEILY